MTPRRRTAALLTVLACLVLAVQSAQATIDPTVDMSPASPYTFAEYAGRDPRATETVTVTQPRPGGRGVLGRSPTSGRREPRAVLDRQQHLYRHRSPRAAAARSTSPSHRPSSAAASAARPVLGHPGDRDYQVSGTGTQPQLAFTPATGLSFSIGIGDTTAPQALSIQNTGDATMNISGITITGTDAARFAKSSQDLRRDARRRGHLHGQRHVHADGRRRLQRDLHVADDALDNPHDANLTGTATIPGVQTTPTSLTFPAQQDGTLGTTMQVTVKNTSASASLKVGTLTIGGINRRSFIFKAGGDACSGTTVAAGATCTVQITFRPRADRRRRAPRCGSRATPPRPRTSRCWERRSPRRSSEACTGRRAAPRRTSAGRRQRRRATSRCWSCATGATCRGPRPTARC